MRRVEGTEEGKRDMRKNIVISLLAGVILTDLPCFVISNNSEKMAMIIGMASAVFIFLLFLEDLYEKWTEYRKRVQRIRRTVRQLRRRAVNTKRRVYAEWRILSGQAHEDARAV